jgi:Tol biopolymer transport system component
MTLFALGLVVVTNLLGQNQGEKHAIKDPEVRKLYDELATKGWIVYSAKTEKDDFDLFIARPNGTNVHKITRTPEHSELDPQFFPDGKRILYRRVGKLNPKVDYREHLYGTLVVANVDGSHPRTLGGEGDYPWPAISPDGRQIACLYKKEGKIRIFDLETLKVVKEIPSQVIHQYLRWSPDGKEFCGAGNLPGVDWGVLTYDIATGKAILISRVMNCTPAWFPDSQRCIFSHRNTDLVSDDGGATAKKTGQDPNASWTMLMMASKDGAYRKLVIAEEYRHLYFSCLSPDNKYVIYCRPEVDSTLTGKMAIIRMSDTPIVERPWAAVEKAYAQNPKRGPVLHLDLPASFHPDWTYAKLQWK